jgi:hypothetical protein
MSVWSRGAFALTLNEGRVPIGGSQRVTAFAQPPGPKPTHYILYTMRKDVIDAFILGGRRWADASNSYVEASTDLATAMRDLADEIEADPILNNGMRVGAAQIRAYATVVEGKAIENRDAFLALTDLGRLIDDLEDYEGAT